MGLNPVVWERARAARILGAVTFHFSVDRLGFLAAVLRSLSEFPVADMGVVIVTNTFRQEDLALLRRLCSEILSGKRPLTMQMARALHANLGIPADEMILREKSVIARNHVLTLAEVGRLSITVMD